MSTTQELNAAVGRAETDKRALEQKIGDEKREAARLIDEKYAEEVKAASRRVWEARCARDNHIDETSSHPWEGKRVFQIKERRGAWSSKVIGHDRLEGIVEVVRQDTELPDNIRYSRPALGSVIVRKVKKNGQPGKQFHDRAYGGFRRDDLMQEWTLEEGETA